MFCILNSYFDSIECPWVCMRMESARSFMQDINHTWIMDEFEISPLFGCEYGSLLCTTLSLYLSLFFLKDYLSYVICNEN